MRNSQVRFHIVAGLSVSPGGAINLDGWETVGKALSLEQAWGIAAQMPDDRPISIVPVSVDEGSKWVS